MRVVVILIARELRLRKSVAYDAEKRFDQRVFVDWRRGIVAEFETTPLVESSLWNWKFSSGHEDFEFHDRFVS